MSRPRSTTPSWPTCPTHALANCPLPLSLCRSHQISPLRNILEFCTNNTCHQVCTLACSAAVISDCEAQAAASGFKSVIPSSYFTVFNPLSLPSPGMSCLLCSTDEALSPLLSSTAHLASFSFVCEGGARTCPFKYSVSLKQLKTAS